MIRSQRSSNAACATCLLALAAATIAASTTAATAHDGHVYSGPRVKLGNGTAHAWVMMDKNHKPKAVGVSISEAAMRDIETVTSEHGEHLTLTLPKQIAGTPFRHVYLNWNPHGHPPVHIWDKPHFDIHFYTTTAAEREAIAENDPAYMEKALRYPPASFIPADYVVEPHPVPAMGTHWVDTTTSELHGKPFTYTLIYGTWDGRVTFVEPMITKAVFDERKPIVAAVKLPAAVAEAGLYPTQYRIDFDPKQAEHRIVLENLVPRDAAKLDAALQTSR